ncbi:MAG: hypothetical protein HY718_06980 [Planctomycetes bacterium]|nr:hypothetical protein [Planctomycetota bacterium]
MSSLRPRQTRVKPSWPRELVPAPDINIVRSPLPGLDREDLAWYVRHYLDRTERLIIMLRYAEELTFDEIAGVLDLPQSEVERVHSEVVNRLGKAMTKSASRGQPFCLAAQAL